MYLVEYHQMCIGVITYIYMCASGVGRKFEVRWNGVGELDLSESLKSQKRL